MKRIFIAAALLINLVISTVVSAQVDQKIYSYDSIDTTISVKSDSTFSVEERQLFDYQQGAFHQGWRAIPLTKVSTITDVEVVDGATGQPLQYSPRRLDKTDPDDWGKYTYYIQGGALNIEWYYDLSNTKHLWILRYTVHGGFEFYKENDRLYWNIFSDYTVPVSTTTVRVLFPAGANISAMKFDAYRTVGAPIVKTALSDGSIYFETLGVAPREAFTIDIAFPKGIVKESAFWREWLAANYGYVGAGTVVVLGLLSLVAYWYWTERRGKGRGIIIPQYEPPQQLHPAMAEIVVKETITEKTWPATIVDLAVRGYVLIKEEDVDGLAVFGRALISIFFLGMICFAVGMFFMKGLLSAPFASIAMFIILIGLVLSKIYIKRKNVRQLFVPKTYVLEKVKEYADDPQVEEYERKFLNILFSEGARFSLQELKRDTIKQREFAEKINTLGEELYKETDIDVPVFDNSMHDGKYFRYALVGVFIGGMILLQAGLIGSNNQLYILLAACVAMAILIVAYIKFEPRLSQQGHLLREDWLGFKLYLETAERYRMQNLTPDVFERYLPYAMIFGIEKQWAKAFEGMNMQAPTWYGAAGTHVGMATGMSSTQAFSPVSFSSSFSSSFASAFASSGGAGGGGGSAGGGGGGGGGGAS